MKGARSLTVMGVTAAVLLVTRVPQEQEARPMAVPHDLAGRADCLMCHAPGAFEGVPGVPPSHAGRASETCLWCHATDSPMLTDSAGAVPHELAGREDCLMCHAAGAMEVVPDAPADHEGRGDQYCTLCHAAPSPMGADPS